MEKEKEKSKEKEKEAMLLLTPAPHMKAGESARDLMLSVIIALVPTTLAGVYLFGFPALWTLMASVVSALAFEFAYQKMTGQKTTLSDGSAAVTGLLLGLNLPATFPWWGTVAGSFFGVILIKHLFGGLGYNIFNPALAARVFLLISWPVQMSTFPNPAPLFSGLDAVTQATPLTAVKLVQLSHDSSKTVEGVAAVPWMDLLLGNRGGSLGEVSALALLLGGMYLLRRGTITWHIPLSFVLTTAVCCSLFYWIDPAMTASPVFHLLNGGLFLGAFFMATDYATSPISKRGMIVFGVGCGFLTALIRQYGTYPEGVSFAILLMNMIVPLTDKYLRPGKFGG